MLRTRALLLGLVLTLAACASRPPPPPQGVGAPVAAASVEQFLQLAGERSYLQMGWVFGTESGPVIEQWPRPEVEKRMFAIANVLQHDSYVVGPGREVPGRIGRAERFVVVLRSGDRQFEVPFVAVRGPGDRWFVEQVDLEAVTNAR